jgi:hypothetical protein
MILFIMELLDLLESLRLPGNRSRIVLSPLGFQ